MPQGQRKRVQILPGKFPDVGAVMIRWLKEPETRPGTVEELVDQLSGLAQIDTDIIRKVEFIDTPMDTALFRLPPLEMVQATLDWLDNANTTISGYQLPDYYGIDTAELDLTPSELFHSRIGDYTTGECR